MTSPAIPATVQDTVNRAVLLAALMKAAGAERDQSREALTEQMPAGMKMSARDPRNGDTLGTVSMSDPGRTAVVVDTAAFEAHVRAEHPGELETERGFGDFGEIAAVLKEHAPHLLTETRVIPDHLRERVLKAAVVQPVPGTKVIRPEPTLRVTPRPAAFRVVNEALAAMAQLELEGKA